MPGTRVWVAAAIALLLLFALPATTAQPPPNIHVWPTVEPDTKKQPYDLGPDRQARFNTTLHLEIQWPVSCPTETSINVTLRVPEMPRWAGMKIGEPVYVEFTVGPGIVPPGERTEPGPPVDIAWDMGDEATNKTVTYRFQAAIEGITGPAGAPETCSPRLSMMERDEGVALVNVTAGAPDGQDNETLDGSSAIPAAPTVAVFTAVWVGVLARRLRS